MTVLDREPKKLLITDQFLITNQTKFFFFFDIL